MNTHFLYPQIRIAPPTNLVKKVVEFYQTDLGLQVIGKFNDHDGIRGVMRGMPDAQYYLEFTHNFHVIPCPTTTKDNLLLCYLIGSKAGNKYSERLSCMI